MLLGDLIAGLEDDAVASETILRVGDLKLLAAMQASAEAEGMDLASYARTAVQRYTAEASNEEWITLMGLLSRADDPGLVCLRRALEHTVHG